MHVCESSHTCHHPNFWSMSTLVQISFWEAYSLDRSDPPRCSLRCAELCNLSCCISRLTYTEVSCLGPHVMSKEMRLSS